LGEAKHEAEQERMKLSCTVEQLSTAQEHIAHLKEEVRIATGSVITLAQKVVMTTLTMIAVTIPLCYSTFRYVIVVSHSGKLDNLKDLLIPIL